MIEMTTPWQHPLGRYIYIYINSLLNTQYNCRKCNQWRKVNRNDHSSVGFLYGLYWSCPGGWGGSLCCPLPASQPNIPGSPSLGQSCQGFHGLGAYDEDRTCRRHHWHNVITHLHHVVIRYDVIAGGFPARNNTSWGKRQVCCWVCWCNMPGHDVLHEVRSGECIEQDVLPNRRWQVPARVNPVRASSTTNKRVRITNSRLSCQRSIQLKEISCSPRSQLRFLWISIH